MPRPPVLGLLAIVACLALPPRPVDAATIAVTTTVDELNTDGDCSLREAVRAANTNLAVDACPAGQNGQTDTITVPAGTYTLTVAGNDRDAAGGDLDLRDNAVDNAVADDLVISGAGATTTIIQACAVEQQSANCPAGQGVVDRVFDVIDARVAMSGITVRHGRALPVNSTRHPAGCRGVVRRPGHAGPADGDVPAVVGTHPGAVVVSARDEVLARLRAARDAGGATAPEVPREYRRSGTAPPGSAEVVDRLAETLADYKATVHRVADEDDVSAVIAEILENAGVTTFVAPPGLPARWLGEVTARVRPDEPPLSVAKLDAVDAVVTGAAVAIADTGTFVLDALAPDQGRRAITLVPDHHVCVVRAADVVSSVPEGVARLDPTHPLTFVSGPSATSDIELDRVEGVHGPRRLDVVLVGPM